MVDKNMTVESIKALGKERSEENLTYLISLFKNEYPVEIRREIVSSIGRQKNLDRIRNFIEDNCFTINCMDLVYQMFRTSLYKGFNDLRDKMLTFYNNEVLNKMDAFYKYKKISRKEKMFVPKNTIVPTLLCGNNIDTLLKIPEESIQLIFTSPPYYNAKEYSDYHSYNDYLEAMKKTLEACYRVLETGRFIIYNVSPVISKRPGREFESIRYPIHYDFHKILTETGFSFVDEIIWVKPDASVPQRNGGFLQHGKPLMYKPNNVTESIMVYQKKGPFLIDEIISKYDASDIFPNMKDEEFEETNVWEIQPKSSRLHPAIFPEKLCEKILMYYSYKNDNVLDPFAGIGTFGKVALDLKRTPVLCEMNQKYIDYMKDAMPELNIK